ncbi:hypothetical protein HG717_36050 (plasmid) [Rhodococcus erythropolis]|uniref:hypothetical protein n=1 Tax=Rhodococcus erythropolis TaxID=1833 RepID=UPI00136AFA71|nr:hypothetical protein [Rhodococcus erythropolis]MBY6389278.1 hypothetical protein [Rhodococcus erythropolis]MYV32029.1 hypothetical protein [Rhodococcus erythropolis]
MTGESFLGQQGNDGIERRGDPPPSRQEMLAKLNERLELVTAIAAGIAAAASSSPWWARRPIMMEPDVP